MPINLAVGGIGAPLAGYVRDATGSYDSIWWVGVSLMVGCYGTVGNDAASARAAKDLAWLTDRHIGLTRMRCYLIYSPRLLRDNC